VTKETGEVFFSIDIETDGPIPVRNSMLSLACVAFAPNGSVLGTFERNIAPLPGAVQDDKTMSEFWAKQPEAWAYCTSNVVSPESAMQDFAEWVKSIPGGQRVAVCMPAGFDFTFTYMYLMMFAGESPFSFSCIDMKTYVCAFRKQAYRNSSKKSWPARWFDSDLPHTHKAIDDAIEQGLTFLKMRSENLNGSDSLKAISANFWNSRGGRPGSIFSFGDGQGKVRVGSDILPFPKKSLTDPSRAPQPEDKVVVRFGPAGEISAIAYAV
jgi:hypothetical protein